MELSCCCVGLETLGLSYQSEFGFQQGALPLSHLSYIGCVFGVATTGADGVALGLVGHWIDAAFDFAKSSVICGGGIIKEIGQLPELKERFGNTIALQDMTYTPKNARSADSFRAGNENFPLSNIMEVSRISLFIIATTRIH